MSNLNQEIIEAKLASYIDGELDPADRAEIEAHLDANPQYRRLVEELRGGRDLLRDLPREQAPPDLAETFTAHLERSALLSSEDVERPSRMRIGGGARMLATAAIIALMSGLGVTVYYVLPGHGGNRIISWNQAPASPTTAPVASAGDRGKPAEVNPVPAHEDAQRENAKEGENKPAAPASPPASIAPAPVALAPDGSNELRAEQKREMQAPMAGAPKGRGARNPFNSDRDANNDAPTAPFAPTAMPVDVRRSRQLEQAPASASPRDGKLEELARVVSEDQAVQSLLDRPTNLGNAGNAGSNARRRTLVMIVHANSVEQVKQQLSSYFGSNAAGELEAAPQTTAFALNNSLGQQGKDIIAEPAAKLAAVDALKQGAELRKDQANATGDEKSQRAALSNAKPVANNVAQQQAVNGQASTQNAILEIAAGAQNSTGLASAAPATPPPAAPSRGTFKGLTPDSETATPLAGNEVDGVFVARHVSRQNVLQLSQYLNHPEPLAGESLQLAENRAMPADKSAKGPTFGGAKPGAALADNHDKLTESVKAAEPVMTKGAPGADAAAGAGAGPRTADAPTTNTAGRILEAMRKKADEEALGGINARATTNPVEGNRAEADATDAVDLVIVVKRDGAATEHAVMVEPEASAPTTQPSE